MVLLVASAEGLVHVAKLVAEFMAELWSAYQQRPDKFTVYRVKKMHEGRYGSAMFHDRAQRAFEAITTIPV